MHYLHRISLCKRIDFKIVFLELVIDNFHWIMMDQFLTDLFNEHYRILSSTTFSLSGI